MLLEVLKTDARTTGRHPHARLVQSRCLISCSVVFDQSGDFYVSSRASAINFGIPDAIYRYAVQQPGGPLTVFQDEYGFLNATTAIYVSILICITQYSLLICPADSASRRRCPRELLPCEQLNDSRTAHI